MQTYRDLCNIERLEVCKGANATIFGRGGIGGLVNRVTKAADGQRHLEARSQGGRYDQYRGQVDLGASLGETASARVTGVYERSDSYRDGVEFERWGINPTVTLAPGADTTITAGYEHFEDDRIADRGVSRYLGRPLRTPRSRFLAIRPTARPARTPMPARSMSNTASATRSRCATGHATPTMTNITATSYPDAVNVAASTIPVGLPAGIYAPGAIVAIQAYANFTDRGNLINQTDFNTTSTTGSIEHMLLTGAEFGRQKTRNLRLEGFFPTAANPLGVQTIFATVANPTVSRPDLLWRAAATSGANRGTATIAAGYVQDRIALSPMFDAVVGVRYEHFDTNVTDLRTVGFPAGQQRDFDVTNDLWSPRGALIFKPDSIEPPRVCRRLQLLRRWSHDEQDDQRVCVRSPQASGADDFRSRAGSPVQVSEKVKALEREVRELRQANKILRKASAYFA